MTETPSEGENVSTPFEIAVVVPVVVAVPSALIVTPVPCSTREPPRPAFPDTCKFPRKKRKDEKCIGSLSRALRKLRKVCSFAVSANDNAQHLDVLPVDLDKFVAGDNLVFQNEIDDWDRRMQDLADAPARSRKISFESAVHVHVHPGRFQGQNLKRSQHVTFSQTENQSTSTREMPRPPTPTVSLVEVMSLPKTTVSPRRLAVISESGRNSGASQAERHALLLSDYTADILCDASKQIEATVGDIATLAQSVRLLFIPALATCNVAVVTSQ